MIFLSPSNKGIVQCSAIVHRCVTVVSASSGSWEIYTKRKCMCKLIAVVIQVGIHIRWCTVLCGNKRIRGHYTVQQNSRICPNSQSSAPSDQQQRASTTDSAFSGSRGAKSGCKKLNKKTTQHCQHCCLTNPSLARSPTSVRAASSSATSTCEIHLEAVFKTNSVVLTRLPCHHES